MERISSRFWPSNSAGLSARSRRQVGFLIFSIPSLFGLGLGVEVSLAAIQNEFARIDRAAPAFDTGFLAFEFFVDSEEVLDLAAHVRPHLIHGGDLRVARAALGHSQNLLVALGGIYQFQIA